METASLGEIKKELKNITAEDLQLLIARLARFKKENKELISYILFEAYNEQAFIEGVKREMDVQFEVMNKSSMYLAKKTIRKVLKTTNKHIRISGKKETEIELLIHFCKKLKSSRLNYKSNRVIFNLYINQIKRIRKALSGLHEDLQYDFLEEVSNL